MRKGNSRSGTPTPSNKQPDIVVNDGAPQNRIATCQKHWAEYMFALSDRGLDEFLGEDQDPQNPAFEGTMTANLAALQFFGPEVICREHDGCPICAFENITTHIADAMALKYKDPH